MKHIMRVWSINTERGWRGGENQVFLLQKAMKNNPNIDSCLVARSGESLLSRSKAEGLSVYPLNMRNGLWAALKLRKEILKNRVDILHAHTSRAHNIAIIATLGTPCRIVVTRRVAFPLRRSCVSLMKYRRASCCVAISQAVKRALVQGGVNERSIPVINDGVDSSLLDAASPLDIRAECGLPPLSVVLFTAAALTKEKGHGCLLYALKRLPPTVHLVLAGEGCERESLSALAQEMSIEGRVHFLGFREDVPRLLKSVDIFILPSISEGLGTIIMDAFFAGVPVVASDTGGIPEIVNDGKTGYLFPSQNVDALVGVLSKLLEDRVLCLRLSVAAYAFAQKKLKYHSMASAYIELYKTICLKD